MRGPVSARHRARQLKIPSDSARCRSLQGTLDSAQTRQRRTLWILSLKAIVQPHLNKQSAVIADIYRSLLFLNLGTRFFIVLTLISLLYLPVINVGYFAIDDYGRALLGYNDFLPAGRPIAALFLAAINFGSVTDIAPLPQYLAIFFLTITTLILASKASIKNDAFLSLLAVCFCGSPYFVENMSFRFDAATMSLAMLFAIAAIPNQQSDLSLGSAARSFVLIFCSLCTYQFAVNCYLVLAPALIAIRLPEKSTGQLLKRLAYYCLPFIAAIAIYAFLFPYMIAIEGHSYGSPTILAAQYIEQQSELPRAADLLRAIQQNVLQAARIIYDDWHANAVGMLWMINIVAAVISINLRTAISGKPWQTTMSMVLVCFSLISVVAVQLPQSNPLIIARSLIGCGALLAIPVITFANIRIRFFRMFGIGLVVMQALAAYSVIYSLRNVLAAHQRYEEQVVQEVSRDILTAARQQKLKHLALSGYLSQSVAEVNTASKFPVAKRIAYTTLYDYFWAPVRLKWAGVSLTFTTLSGTQKNELIDRKSVV